MQEFVTTDVTDILKANYPYVVSISNEVNPLVHFNWLEENIGTHDKRMLCHGSERYYIRDHKLNIALNWHISFSQEKRDHKVFFQREQDAVLFKIMRF